MKKCYIKSHAQNEIGGHSRSLEVTLERRSLKNALEISDEENLEQISENPYLQFFSGA